VEAPTAPTGLLRHPPAASTGEMPREPPRRVRTFFTYSSRVGVRIREVDLPHGHCVADWPPSRPNAPLKMAGVC